MNIFLDNGSVAVIGEGWETCVDAEFVEALLTYHPFAMNVE